MMAGERAFWERSDFGRIVLRTSKFILRQSACHSGNWRHLPTLFRLGEEPCQSPWRARSIHSSAKGEMRFIRLARKCTKKFLSFSVVLKATSKLLVTTSPAQSIRNDFRTFVWPQHPPWALWTIKTANPKPRKMSAISFDSSTMKDTWILSTIFGIFNSQILPKFFLLFPIFFFSFLDQILFAKFCIF